VFSEWQACVESEYRQPRLKPLFARSDLRTGENSRVSLAHYPSPNTLPICNVFKTAASFCSRASAASSEAKQVRSQSQYFAGDSPTARTRRSTA
jgi:hypothetical protein